MVETGNTKVAAEEIQVRNTGENKGCCKGNTNKKHRKYKGCSKRNTNKIIKKCKGSCKRNTNKKNMKYKGCCKRNINNKYRKYKSWCYYCLSRLSHSLTEDQSEQCASSPS